MRPWISTIHLQSSTCRICSDASTYIDIIPDTNNVSIGNDHKFDHQACRGRIAWTNSSTLELILISPDYNREAFTFTFSCLLPVLIVFQLTYDLKLTLQVKQLYVYNQ